MRAGISDNRWIVPAISLLVALTFGAWSVERGQDMNWDLLNYHLYNPYAFLHDRIETDLAPAGVQTYFSPMLDIAYFKTLSSLSPKMVGFLLGFLQGLNFLLLCGIAQAVLKDRWPRYYTLLLALAGVLCIGFLAEVGTTMQDSLVALFPLLSLWMILASIETISSTERRRATAQVIGAGVIAGIGIGLKLVVAIYALPLCLAMLVLPLPWTGRFKLAFLFGFSVLAGLVATGGYWLYEVWRLFGNPLFPQFNNIFHGELASFSATRDLRFLPEGLLDKAIYPLLFTFDPQRAVEIRYEQYSWLFAYLAILGLFVHRLVRVFTGKGTATERLRPEAVYLLAFFCIAYLLWLNIFGIYRYLLVIELLIPLLLFVIVTHLFRHRRTPAASLVFLALLTFFNTRDIPDWGHAGWAQHVYQVEANVLQAKHEPAAVYLAGQPLAWLIPALGIDSPFIQVAPNMTVSDAYWERAKILSAKRPGQRFIIYSDDADITERTLAALEKLGLSTIDESCDNLHASLGDAGFAYRFCELDYTEPQ